MKPASLVGFFVLIVLVALAFVVAGYYVNKRRQQAFTAWAAQHGFDYRTSDDRYAEMPWGEPFGNGFGHAALDVLTSRGSGRRPVLCFTYRYKTQSSNGKTTTTQTHYYAVYSVGLAKPLPTLQVGREGIFSSLARAVGIHDIEFESEDFNREFKVKSDDRKFASDVINPQMMQFLMDAQAPGFTIVGTDIVLVRSGRLDLAEVLPTVGYLDAVVERIPDFVWEVH